MEDPALAVSVVVPTYRGARRVARLLEELEHQTLPADRFEVVVVDDASPEGLDLPDVPGHLRVLRQAQNGGPAVARNTGLAVARGTVVAFTDDDCSPDPTWLEELLAGFTDEGVLGVAGLMEPYAESGPGVAFDFQRAQNPWGPISGELEEDQGRAHRLWIYLRSQLSDDRGPTSGDTTFAAAGGNTAFLREELVAAGGFRTDLRTAEDIEVCMRMRRLHPDRRLVYRPEARVAHRIDGSARTLVHRYRVWGMGLLDFGRATGAAPVVYPWPVLVGAALVAGRARPRATALAAALPLAAYGRWTRRAVREREPRALLFCYLQLATEGASDLGLAQAVLASWRGDGDTVGAATLTRYAR